MKISDQAQRNEALDINKSQVVVSPAGSGKTAFLSQRYLKLLCTVNKPSQIQFLTHTNKATKEMRDRVIAALKNALVGQRPVIAHEALSFDLAKAVLERDAKLGWNILDNPNQLNIKTNDALNSQLVNSAMLTSKLGSSSNVSKEPRTLYSQAAMNILNLHKSNSHEEALAVKKLLKLVGNNFEQAEELLINLLAKRDQWLPIVMEVGTGEDAREMLEDSLKQVIQSIVGPVVTQLQPYLPQIAEISDFCRQYAQGDAQDLVSMVDDDIQSISTASDAAKLRAIAGFLLTAESRPSFRKSATASVGFPVMKDIKDKIEKEIIKEKRDDYKSLLAELAEVPDLLDGMRLIKMVPSPSYQDSEWDLLESLLSLMPLAVAHLKLVFNQAKEVDFSEVATAALHTLGTLEIPEEQLLKLDNTIRHILVDEFQDTNLNQLRFIEKMVSGWTQGDGRTLTVVGDPMQSIYLFRMANVGLFANVMKDGIGGVKMDLVQFTSNFRSQEGVISDVNNIFAQAMPQKLDVNFGAIPYSSSVAVKPNMGDSLSCVFFDGSSDVVKENEAQYIFEQVLEIQKTKPKASIAVIARARNDLSAIMSKFKAEQLGHIAVDILKLKDNEVVMDAIDMTKACFDDNDQVAWTGFLRSPLVGLSLDSIMRLSPKKKFETYFVNLQNKSLLAGVATSEQSKIERLVNVLKQARMQTFRKTIVDIAKGLFIELKGLSAIRNSADKEALTMFFKMLESFNMELPEQGQIDFRVESLYAEDMACENPVKIMTIHKAKGLEFDFVFIPQSQKGTRSDGSELMVSDVLIGSDGQINPVIAPLVKDSSDSVYSFVRKFTSIKKLHEVVRTCYVAMTRAKVQTIMTGGSKTNLKGKAPQFLAGSYFAIAAANVEGITITTDEESYEKEDTAVTRRVFQSYASRLLPESKVLAQYRGVENINNDILPSLDSNETWKSSIGTVIHTILENISKVGVDKINLENLAMYKEQWRLALIEEGVPPQEVIASLKHVSKCVGQILTDDKGLWILSDHVEAHSEFALNIKESGKIKTIILDRVFQEDNIQYIVDYKSGEMRPGEGEAEYISRMLNSFRPKMEAYSDAMLKLNGLPQNVGLYLLPIGKFVTYDQEALAAA